MNTLIYLILEGKQVEMYKVFLLWNTSKGCCGTSVLQGIGLSQGSLMWKDTHAPLGVVPSLVLILNSVYVCHYI